MHTARARGMRLVRSPPARARLQEVIGPLREELQQLKLAEKLAELKQGIEGLKAGDAAVAAVEEAVAAPAAPSAATPAPAAMPMSPASRAAAARPPPAPLPPPPPPPAFPLCSWASTVGVEGQRCAVLFYAYDGPKIAEAMLDAFEDEAAEFAACGCALVGVRKVERGDAYPNPNPNPHPHPTLTLPSPYPSQGGAWRRGRRAQGR